MKLSINRYFGHSKISDRTIKLRAQYENDGNRLAKEIKESVKLPAVKNSTFGWEVVDGNASDFVKDIEEFASIGGFGWSTGHRKRSNTNTMFAIIIDIDDNGDALNLNEDLKAMTAIAYYSISQNREYYGTDKFRLVIPLFSELEIGKGTFDGETITSEYLSNFSSVAQQKLAGLYGFTPDKQTYDTARLMLGATKGSIFHVQDTTLTRDLQIEIHNETVKSMKIVELQETRVKALVANDDFKCDKLNEQQQTNLKTAIDFIKPKSIDDSTHNKYWLLAMAWEKVGGERSDIYNLTGSSHGYDNASWDKTLYSAYSYILSIASSNGWSEVLSAPTIKAQKISEVIHIETDNLCNALNNMTKTDKFVMDAKVNIIQSHQGTQKTRMFIEEVSNFDHRMVAIVHRVALVENMVETLNSGNYNGFKSYAEIPDVERGLFQRGLVTTVHSLSYFNFDDEYSIWLDEYTQMWRCLKQLLEGKNKLLLNVLKNVLRNAKTIYLTDADYDEQVIEDILSLANVDADNCKIIRNEYIPKLPNIIPYDNCPGVMLNRIIKLLKAGEPCAVAFNIKGTLKRFLAKIKEDGILSEDQIVHITGEDDATSKKAKVSEITRSRLSGLDKLTGKSSIQNVKLLAYTSAAYTGVSINKHCFRNIFGVFEKQDGIISDDMMQALNRCRQNKKRIVENWHILIASKTSYQNNNGNFVNGLADQLRDYIKEHDVDMDDLPISTRIDARAEKVSYLSSNAGVGLLEKLINRYNYDQSILEENFVEDEEELVFDAAAGRISKEDVWNSVDVADEALMSKYNNAWVTKEKLSDLEITSVHKRKFEDENVLEFAKDLKYDIKVLADFLLKAKIVKQMEHDDIETIRGELSTTCLHLKSKQVFTPFANSVKINRYLNFLKKHSGDVKLLTETKWNGEEKETVICDMLDTMGVPLSAYIKYPLRTFLKHIKLFGYEKREEDGRRMQTLQRSKFFDVLIGTKTNIEREDSAISFLKQTIFSRRTRKTLTYDFD